MIALAFDNPAALGLLGAAAAALLLFMLKRRRRDQPVSSTMLWRRAMKETVARAPFRRPSEWVSLILLLAALIALAFGAAGMRQGELRGDGRTVVVVVDVSASMTTREDGGTRFDIARDRARELIAGLGEGDHAVLIAAGATPRLVGYASGDSGPLLRMLGELQAEPQGCALRPALEMALAEVRRARGGVAPELVVLSDFCHAAAQWEGLDMKGAQLTLARCDGKAENAGIVHAAFAGDEGEGRLLVRVAGIGSRNVSLYNGDRLIDAREVRLATGQEETVVFRAPVPQGAGEVLRLGVRLDPADAQTLDDAAYVAVSRAEPARLLHVGAENSYLSRLAQAIPDLVFDRVDAADLTAQREKAAAPYDLAVITEPVAGVVPARRELYMGCAPDGLDLSIEGELVQPVIIDWERTHSMLRGASLDSLVLLKAVRVKAGPAARAIARLKDGPLLLEQRAPGRQVYVWASRPEDSNLLLRPAFPILVANLLGDAISRVRGHLAQCEAGVGFELPVGAGGATSIDAVLPRGRKWRAEVLPGEQALLRGPLPPGFCRAELRGAEFQQDIEVGIALLDVIETAARPQPPNAGQFGAGSAQVVEAANWNIQRPLWELLSIVALLLLAAELGVWMLTQRRLKPV
ncbi:MAG: VWA domain-containing protein [Planctomycetes bacterium]|nr:VWA domain-containing protein [Planctomycetota bacterium]